MEAALLRLGETAAALQQNGVGVLRDLCDVIAELTVRGKNVDEAASRLTADRASLDAERRQFEAERESVRQLNAQGSDCIVLDVGGRQYATTRQTLCAVPGSMLAAWFSGRHAIQTRPDGTVFIERSPVLFDYVLDFLRTNDENPLLPSDEDLRRRLHGEFLFFGLDWPEEPKMSVIDILRGDLTCGDWGAGDE